MPSKTITVRADTFDELKKLLEAGKQVEKFGRDATIRMFTAVFDNGYEVDVKVVNSEDGPWTEAVLHQDGCEITCSEVDETLDGEWILWDDNTKFIVNVMRGDE